MTGIVGPRCLWKCDNGTYDICEEEGVVHQNVPVQVLAAAPEMKEALERIANSEEFHGDTVVCDFATLQSVARAALSAIDGGVA